MWGTFVLFCVSAFSLWFVKKVMGEGLQATFSAIITAALIYACAGLASTVLLFSLQLPPLLTFGINSLLQVFILPSFIFWFAHQFIDGFRLKAIRYFTKACCLFAFMNFLGIAIAQVIPFIGLGLFCGGGSYAGRYARPSWFYDQGYYDD
jgi:uncharacterized membrane protein YvlD (DUF360 family)